MHRTKAHYSKEQKIFKISLTLSLFFELLPWSLMEEEKLLEQTQLQNLFDEEKNEATGAMMLQNSHWSWNGKRVGQ